MYLILNRAAGPEVEDGPHSVRRWVEKLPKQVQTLFQSILTFLLLLLLWALLTKGLVSFDQCGVMVGLNG